MKPIPRLARSNKSVFFVVFVAVFFSTANLQAQPNVVVERMKASLQKQIDGLDAGWDKASYNMPVMSSAYTKAKYLSSYVSNSLGIYSFKGNVKDAPNQQKADQRLKTLALLLRKASDEMAATTQKNMYFGELKQFKSLLKFVAFTVSNKPLSLNRMNFKCLNLKELDSRNMEQSLSMAEAMAQVAEKLDSTAWMAPNKHLAYKYLTASLLNVPAFWAYLEPEFSRLVLEAGASTDKIVFVKLHMNREPFILQDSRIWNKSPRFQASQLQLVEAGVDAKNQSGHVKRVELSDKETKVTVRYTVGGREMWYRFDNSMALVDNETKELYPIQRIENKLPLGKTFIVVGCEGMTVEFTLVFPPLKPSLKQFVLDDNLTVPTSEKAKKRYLKKHGIMSDGSGRTPIVIYNLSEVVTADTRNSNTLVAKPVQSTPDMTSFIGKYEPERVVKESKPNGRTAEWTYKSDKLVGGKVFFPSGKVEELYNYVNGVREGDSYQYYENGDIFRKWTYKNGLMVEGVAYYETGELKFKYRYVNGLQHGITTAYAINGTISGEWNYVDGKLNGISKEYLADGKYVEWNYESGNVLGQTRYYKSGKPQLIWKYVNGVLDGVSNQYFETGEIEAKWTYENGVETGGIIYFNTGEKRTVYSYANGKLNGPTVTYNKSGNVVQKTDCKDGKTHGQNTLFYDDGKLWLVQNFVDGKRQGEELTYDRTGKVTSRKMYVDNKLVE